MNDERAANGVDKKVGQRVRSRRLEIGMSQERLAELLGVTFQQVQKYEKGVNRIAISRYLDITRALDVDPGKFLDGIAVAGGVAETRATFVEDVLATPEGAQLMALFASIKSQKLRRRVVDLVRTLTEDEGGKR